MAAGLEVGAGVEVVTVAGGGAGPTTTAGGSATGELEPPVSPPLPVETGVEADPLPTVPGWVPLVPTVEPVVTGGVLWLLLPSSCPEEPGCELTTGVALSEPSSLVEPVNTPDWLPWSSSVSTSCVVVGLDVEVDVEVEVECANSAASSDGSTARSVVSWLRSDRSSRRSRRGLRSITRRLGYPGLPGIGELPS
jgi:hypothetical protein